MHFTSLKSGQAFSETYGIQNGIVLDIGGKNVNGSLRPFFEQKNMRYICIDIESDPSVDIISPAGEKMPFNDQSIDLIISTSCFEHDPCFWLTFKEMTRIIKRDGYIYVNAPTSGPHHTCPGDNWRFYADAGQALAYWSGKQVSNEEIFPVKVLESFIITNSDYWNDFVCVWKRTNEVEKNIVFHKNGIGILEQTLHNYGLQTR